MMIDKDSITFPYLRLQVKIRYTEEPLPYKVFIKKDGEWILRAEEFFFDEIWGLLNLWDEKFGGR